MNGQSYSVRVESAKYGVSFGSACHCHQPITKHLGARIGVLSVLLTKAAIIEDVMAQSDKAAAAGRHSAAVRANELLGKALGMFIQRTEIARGKGPQVLAKLFQSGGINYAHPSDETGPCPRVRSG